MNQPTIKTDIAPTAINLSNLAAADKNDSQADLMFFSGRTGLYSYNVDEVTASANSVWAFNPRTFIHGYAAWGEGEILEEHTVNMFSPPIEKSTLQHLTYSDENGKTATAKWAPVRGCEIQCIAGDDIDAACLLKGASQSFASAMAKIYKAISRRVIEKETDIVPLVELKNSSYTHKIKSRGVIYNPAFSIVGWAPMADSPSKYVPASDNATRKITENRKRPCLAEDAEVKAVGYIPPTLTEFTRR